jgi:hypothetical protein
MDPWELRVVALTQSLVPRSHARLQECLLPNQPIREIVEPGVGEQDWGRVMCWWHGDEVHIEGVVRYDIHVWLVG